MKLNNTEVQKTTLGSVIVGSYSRMWRTQQCIIAYQVHYLLLQKSVSKPSYWSTMTDTRHKYAKRMDYYNNY